MKHFTLDEIHSRMTLAIPPEQLLRGRKKGSADTPPIPTEDPNTLQALSYLTAVDLLCEGPILGLVNCGQSIFFDDVPLQNSDGSFNFLATVVDFRLGYPDQTPLDGFPDVETAFSVGVEVKHFQPVTRTINDIKADQVNVTLGVQGLFYQDLSTGNTHGYSVSYTIEVQQVDDTVWTSYASTLSGKTRSEYQWDTIINLPGVGPWNIRVTKTQLDDATSNFQSQLLWPSYTTIRNRKYTYGDSAVVGTHTNAQALAGKVPTRTFEIYAKIVQIPTNYNQYLRTYQGDWDGTFTTGWTNNPAWVLYDLLVNDRYGLGHFIGNFKPDKWRFYQIAQYCDGLVPDGFGGQEHRFSFNGRIPSTGGGQQQAFKVIQDVASTFRGMVFYGGGSIWAVADMPSDPVQLFTQADVVDGRFTYSGVALDAIHFQALMTWLDPNQQYQPQVELVQDLTTDTWNQIERQLNGCTSRGEAHRYGKWLLDTERNATQTVSFTASWEHAAASPGDIILIADPMWDGIRAGGRLKSLTAVGSPPSITTVELDAPYDFLNAVTYHITVVLPSGKLQTQLVTNAPGIATSVTFDSTLVEVPIPGAVFAITGDVTPKQYRVLVVKETSKALFEYTALEHDPTKYDRIEQNLVLEVPIAPVRPVNDPDSPSDILITQGTVLLGSTLHPEVTVSWQRSQDTFVAFYNIEYQDSFSIWHSAGTSTGQSKDILDLGVGTFSFRVQSVDIVGHMSAWLTSAPVYLYGLNAPPPDVQNFNFANQGDQSLLTWDAVQSGSLAGYAIRFSPQVSGASWQTAQLLQTGISTTQFTVPTLKGTYLIKAVSTQGVESTNATLVVADIEATTLNVVQTYAGEPDWTGTKTNVERSSTSLVLTSNDFMSAWTTLDTVHPMAYYANGYDASGEYDFPDTLDLGSVQTARISFTIDVAGLKVSGALETVEFLTELTNLSGVDNTDWGFQAQYRTTPDDPGGSPVWSAWKNLVAATDTFRGAQFRLLLTSQHTTVTPIVYSADITVDMSDRSQSAQDVLAPAPGLAIVFGTPFFALTTLSVTAQDMQTGDYFQITGKSGTGFTINFFNSANVGISRTFDYLAQGY